MIEPVDNDTALEEVLAFLDKPPVPGSPDDERFGARLRQVLSASIADEPEDEDDPAAGWRRSPAGRPATRSANIRTGSGRPWG